MAIGKRLGLGVALAATPVALFVSPAAAATSGSDTQRRELTFTYGEVERTCAVFARTSYRYLEDRNSTVVSASTYFEGPEACAEVVLQSNVTVTYRNANGVEEVSAASTPSTSLDTVFTEQGAITDISGTHGVVYRCDPPWIDSCSTEVTTHPK